MGFEFIEALSVGGDVAILAMLYLAHRFDRRLYALELKLKGEA